MSALIRRRARYVDKNEKIWPGVVKAVEDPFLVIKFDEFPSGLGQGQIIEIFEEGDK